MDTKSTQLVITVVSSNNVQYVINLVVTVAFVIGVGIGMLIQFLLSKLSISKLLKMSIYIISVIASIIAILQAFGEWKYLLNLIHKILEP